MGKRTLAPAKTPEGQWAVDRRGEVLARMQGIGTHRLVYFTRPWHSNRQPEPRGPGILEGMVVLAVVLRHVWCLVFADLPCLSHAPDGLSPVHRALAHA